MANLAALQDDTFEAEVVNSDKPVLVDFSATWCGPCKALAPTVEAIAQEYEGKVKVYTVDIEQAQQTAMKYQVMQVPTLLMFKDGAVVGTLMGNRPKSDLVELVGRALD